MVVINFMRSCPLDDKPILKNLSLNVIVKMGSAQRNLFCRKSYFPFYILKKKNNLYKYVLVTI